MADEPREKRTMFGRMGTFSELFPNVDLRCTILECGPGTRYQWASIDAPIQEWIPCRNWDCTKKGLHLGKILRDMDHNGIMSKEGTEDCEGQQRRRGVPCPTFFKYTIQMKRKPSADVTEHTVDE